MSLSPAQQSRLGATAATIGSNLHSQKLGSILHSDITYVGSNLYTDTSALLKTAPVAGQDQYAAYHAKRKAAKPVIYVGGFDNLLHAFDAETGKELFAYAPAELLKQSMFTQDIRDPGIGVDGSHYVTDVY